MKENKISQIIKELEGLFKHFNIHLFDNSLPFPIITIQSGRGRVKGWFTTEKWINSTKNETQHEINISSEVLSQKTKKGIPQVVITLLHEMVHLYNYKDGIRDMSKNGYHIKKIFGRKSEEKGLEVEYIKKFPGCLTNDLNDDGINIYKKFHFKEDIFTYYRIIRKVKGKLKPLQCPKCLYKVQVYYAFEHKLECKTCCSILVDVQLR